MNQTERQTYTVPDGTDTKHGAERWLFTHDYRNAGLSVRLRIAADFLRLRRIAADEKRLTDDGEGRG